MQRYYNLNIWVGIIYFFFFRVAAADCLSEMLEFASFLYTSEFENIRDTVLLFIDILLHLKAIGSTSRVSIFTLFDSVIRLSLMNLCCPTFTTFNTLFIKVNTWIWAFSCHIQVQSGQWSVIRPVGNWLYDRVLTFHRAKLKTCLSVHCVYEHSMARSTPPGWPLLDF